MEMPTPCNSCGDLFDLNDGYESFRKPGIVICKPCARKEEEEIDREEEIIELKAQIADAEYTLKAAKERLAELGSAESAESSDSRPQKRKWPEECPITRRKFFMEIEHPDFGNVPTFGGPFDSYMIPNVDYDGDLRCERYDHDRGEWIEGGEPLAIYLTTAQPDDADLPDFVERKQKANDRSANCEKAEVNRVYLS